MTATRTNITLPDDMRDALQEIAEQRGATMAALIRLAVAQWLAEHGYNVESVLSWGGVRDKNGQ